MRSSRAAALLLLAALAACGRREAAPVPGITDAPTVGRAVRKEIPELVPAYGITADGGADRFVVNIEAADAPRVRAGQTAEVSVLTSSAPIRCRVERVLRGASAETNQALAWLVPLAAARVAPNDFVTASIEVARRRALTVPRDAVMIRDDRAMVLRVSPGPDGKASYARTPVVTGLAAGDDVEISSGITDRDEIVVSGGIGLMFPEFKAAGD